MPCPFRGSYVRRRFTTPPSFGIGVDPQRLRDPKAGVPHRANARPHSFPHPKTLFSKIHPKNTSEIACQAPKLLNSLIPNRIHDDLFPRQSRIIKLEIKKAPARAGAFPVYRLGIEDKPSELLYLPITRCESCIYETQISYLFYSGHLRPPPPRGEGGGGPRMNRWRGRPSCLGAPRRKGGMTDLLGHGLDQLKQLA
jgi:hypothetical protein